MVGMVVGARWRSGRCIRGLYLAAEELLRVEEYVQLVQAFDMLGMYPISETLWCKQVADF